MIVDYIKWSVIGLLSVIQKKQNLGNTATLKIIKQLKRQIQLKFVTFFFLQVF